MTTIPQNAELLKNLFDLFEEHVQIADRQEVRTRLELLMLSEVFTFGKHTITQQLMSLAAYIGITPQHFESGTWVKKRATISKQGNARLRCGLSSPC